MVVATFPKQIGSASSPSREGAERSARTAGPRFEGAVPSGYEVLYFLGQGSFSEVWKVGREMSGGCGALKRLRAEWRGHAAARQLLQNEAEVGRALRSPHVARVLYSDTASEDPCIILEWLEGRTLEELLADESPLSIRKSIWIARQCAAGLADLERAGYAHGDVKPANIFLCTSGEAKLVDLGFARPLAGPRSQTLTGTPEYMAPETLSPADLNPAARDMYSLGITLYRMLAGALPLSAETPAETLQLQRAARPAGLRRLRPDVSPELADFVGKLLAKHPLRRPENWQAVVRELLRLELSALSSPYPAG